MGRQRSAARSGSTPLRLSWVSRPILLSIRNTFRRKGRLILTLFTLTIGGAIFIGVFNVRASMEDFLEQLRQHFMADVTLYLEEPYRVSEVERDVLNVPGVRAVEAWSMPPTSCCRWCTPNCGASRARAWRARSTPIPCSRHHSFTRRTFACWATTSRIGRDVVISLPLPPRPCAES